MAERTKQSPATWPLRRGFMLERLVVGLLLLCVALAGAGVFLTTIGLFSPVKVFPIYGAQIEQAVLLPGFPHGLGRLVSGALGVVVGLTSVMLLVRRVVPASRSAYHVLSADEQGLVLVDKRGISTVAEAAVERVAGVVETTVRVIGQATSMVRLLVHVWVHAGAEIQRVGEDAKREARSSVENLVGLEVHDVLVRMHVVPTEDLDRVVE